MQNNTTNVSVTTDTTTRQTHTVVVTVMASPRRPPAPVVVNSSGGIILGKTHGVTASCPRAVDAFYGLPYARVPVRFRPAVAVSPGSFTRFDASTAGKGKQPMYTSASATAEKTLTLNIFRPSPAAAVGEQAKRERKLLPVVVFIHGGAFNFSEPLERDHVTYVSWAGQRGGSDVMVVSICYRLGALGFLAGDDEDREVNLGLKDQRLAVEWVREHIDVFGGDGTDLTLMGISAGAHSIGHHILDPRRAASPRPLFHKAILESGSPTARSVLSASHPRNRAQHASLARAASLSSPGSSKTLETLDVANLLEAAMMVWAENHEAVTWPFQPVVEDGPHHSASPPVIPDTPLRLWERFAEHMLSWETREEAPQSIAVITGFCSHEGVMFVPGRASTNAEFRAFFSTLIPAMSAADLDALERLYPDPVTDPTSPYKNHPVHAQGKGAQFTRLHEAYAHYAYICPVLYTAHMLSSIADKIAAAPPSTYINGAKKEKPTVKVYVYEYAALAGQFPAAGHGDQAAIVAHDMAQLHGRPGLAAVAREMHSRWTAFAASADGSLSKETWPEFRTPFSSSASCSLTGISTALEGITLEDVADRGNILVFGKGNDEKVPGSAGHAGAAVEERCLTEAERRQCLFWWERMEMSQGARARGGAV